MEHWHCTDLRRVADALKTDPGAGLTEGEAASRLAAQGPNELAREKSRGVLQMLAAQFADFMILVLIGAAIVSGVLGEVGDTVAIVVIVLLNAVIGTIQEYRAQRAVAALRRMAAPTARVLRDGEVALHAASELVTGDLVVLEAGDVVPADLRLSEALGLRIDESALTGESLAVDKHAGTLAEPDLSVGDRSNMAYRSTAVVRGRGTGIVVATGQETEIGRIAELLRPTADLKTPLQVRLARFGKQLTLAILGLCVLLFALGLLTGKPPLLMFLTAVSLAVAAVPEALPAVVIISLALGARQLAVRNALVRRLPAVEALGSVTYICSDKTGTLTQNRMTVSAVLSDGRMHESLPVPDSGDASERLGQAMALSNDVSSTALPGGGDPTEVALLAAATRAGFQKEALLGRMPRVAELAFDAGRKLMTTVHREGEGAVAFVKGAPEALLPRCDSAATASRGPVALDAAAVLSQAEHLAQQGYRTLAFAMREFPSLPDVTAPDIEEHLTYLGIVALSDPPRAEAPAAVADCVAAGIVPVMITGDHPRTAQRIAADLGIAKESGQVITGSEIARLSDEELRRRSPDLRVYARVDPEQKVRIVSSLQDAGEFVAMTGDGVNDAPALKRATIGVAMGQRGTDVAREAADLVLLDDNFATIVSAVKEGRRIYDDIRKFVKYTLTSNSGEILTLLMAPLLGLPLPLLPIHILWINLVTDGMPGLALSAEPAERGTMSRPPRPPGESIFANGLWQHMLWVGLLIGALSVLAQAWGYYRGAHYWQTMVFTTLVVAQLFHSLAVRSDRDSLLTQGLLSNRLLLGAVVLTLAAQLAVIYVPALNPIFKTQPLPLPELVGCIALGAVVLVAVELEKWFVRRGWLYAKRSPRG